MEAVLVGPARHHEPGPAIIGRPEQLEALETLVIVDGSGAFRETSGDLVSETLGHSMAQLSDRVTASEGQLGSGIASLRQAMDRNQQESAAAIQSRAATDQAMQRLSGTILDLGDRLSEFRDAQAALAPILNHLADPMEIRLTPTAVPAPSRPAPGASPPVGTGDNA